MTDSVRESLNDLIAYDDARASAPFEHGFVAVAGLGLLACAVAAPSRGRAVFHAAMAGALLFRAASGKDGLRKWVEAAQPKTESKWVIARP
ncbi:MULTISPECIES: hypothetical protein [unclassified Acidovorax]|uniref:hypothetical protein n=1 Tax=unclassified Acidovorax TaxID=2684926 RepID=UPI002883122F|nr:MULTISPECIES: hypothetical protein [unclassified Acidovorax]